MPLLLCFASPKSSGFTTPPVVATMFAGLRSRWMILFADHARICILHDVGHQDGIDFPVLECLEGETLAERLRRERCRCRGGLEPPTSLMSGAAVSER